jgi:hypothetical protein
MLCSPTQWPLYKTSICIHTYSFFPSIYAFTSLCEFTPFLCFYKGCTQSNQQLALSQLMHRIHCSSAIFPCQERRPAQETLTGCMGLHKKFKSTEHSPYTEVNNKYFQS